MRATPHYRVSRSLRSGRGNFIASVYNQFFSGTVCGIIFLFRVLQGSCVNMFIMRCSVVLFVFASACVRAGGQESEAPGLKLLAEVTKHNFIAEIEKERASVNRRLRRGLHRLEMMVGRYAEQPSSMDDISGDTFLYSSGMSEVGMLKPTILTALQRAVESQRFLDAACHQLQSRAEGVLLHGVMSDLSELIACERQ